jgi:hypothetical protein
MATTKVKLTPAPAKPAINIFAKAKAGAASIPVPTVVPANIKETQWLITNEKLANSITEMNSLKVERKQIENKELPHKTALAAHAIDQYALHLASAGVLPKTPMRLVNEAGESVTFVIQDKGASTKISDEKLAQLAQLLGRDKDGKELVDQIIYNGGSFGFDENILDQKSLVEGQTVMDVVGEALGAVLAKLVEDQKITEEQGNNLVQFETTRRYIRGLPRHTVDVCGRDVPKILSYLKTVGSAIVRYVKAD